MITFVDGAALSAVQLNSLHQDGASINGCPIGQVTPAAGSFTTLTASGTVTFPTLASSDNSTKAATTAFVQSVAIVAGAVNPAAVALTGGTINGITIGATTPSTGAFTTLKLTTIPTTDPGVANTVWSDGGVLCLSGGTPGSPGPDGPGSFTTLTSSGAATLASAIISGGSINATVIGGSTAAAGTFTTLNSTGGVLNGTLGASTPATAAVTSLTVSQAVVMPPRIVGASSNTTLTSTDYIVAFNRSSSPAATVVTLPATVVAGRMIKIIDMSGNAGSFNITVQPSSGTIDGVATFLLDSNYGVVDFYAASTTAWVVI